MPKKKGRSGLVYGKPRFALLARVLSSIVSDCVTVKICVFQPERGVDESGELGKDKWRQRLLSAMAAGNPVNGALSLSLSLILASVSQEPCFHLLVLQFLYNTP